MTARMVHVRMKAVVSDHEGAKLKAGDELDVTLEQARGWIGLNRAMIVLPPDTATVPPEMAGGKSARSLSRDTARIPRDTAKGKRDRAEKS